MYAPGLGRFLQPDPIGYAGGKHLYAYIGNDPLTVSIPQKIGQTFILAPYKRPYTGFAVG